MRTVALVFSLLFAAQARADGLSAAATVMTDRGLRDSQVRLEAVGGDRSVSVATGSDRFFEFASYDWLGRSFEAGAGLRWRLGSGFQLVVGTSGIIAPVGGVSGGGRVLAAISAQLGQQGPFVRPGAAISYAFIGGAEALRMQLPLNLSLEGGYAWPFGSVYLRVAGTFDALKSFQSSAHLEPSLGVAFPLDIVPVSP